jgi:hypothetical protein
MRFRIYDDCVGKVLGIDATHQYLATVLGWTTFVNSIANAPSIDHAQFETEFMCGSDACNGDSFNPMLFFPVDQAGDRGDPFIVPFAFANQDELKLMHAVAAGREGSQSTGAHCIRGALHVHGDAGLNDDEYLTSAVCHQVVNRLLACAGQYHCSNGQAVSGLYVTGALSSERSLRLWGVFGRQSTEDILQQTGFSNFDSLVSDHCNNAENVRDPSSLIRRFRDEGMTKHCLTLIRWRKKQYRHVSVSLEELRDMIKPVLIHYVGSTTLL